MSPSNILLRLVVLISMFCVPSILCQSSVESGAQRQGVQLEMGSAKDYHESMENFQADILPAPSTASPIPSSPSLSPSPSPSAGHDSSSISLDSELSALDSLIAEQQQRRLELIREKERLDRQQRIEAKSASSSSAGSSSTSTSAAYSSSSPSASDSLSDLLDSDDLAEVEDEFIDPLLHMSTFVFPERVTAMVVASLRIPRRVSIPRPSVEIATAQRQREQAAAQKAGGLTSIFHVPPQGGSIYTNQLVIIIAATSSAIEFYHTSLAGTFLLHQFPAAFLKDNGASAQLLRVASSSMESMLAVATSDGRLHLLNFQVHSVEKPKPKQEVESNPESASVSASTSSPASSPLPDFLRDFRIRVQLDATIEPAFSEAAYPHSNSDDQNNLDMFATDSEDNDKVTPRTQLTVNALAVYQQHKHVLLLAAYSSGSLHVHVRNGTLRDSVSLGSSRVSALTFGGTPHVDGGRATGRKEQQVANVHQLTFVNEEGYGVMRVTRQKNAVDAFCPLSLPPLSQPASSSANQPRLTSIAYDSASPALLYAATSDGRVAVLNSRYLRSPSSTTSGTIQSCSPLHLLHVETLRGAGGGIGVSVATFRGYLVAAGESSLYFYNVTRSGSMPPMLVHQTDLSELIHSTFSESSTSLTILDIEHPTHDSFLFVLVRSASSGIVGFVSYQLRLPSSSASSASFFSFSFLRTPLFLGGVFVVVYYQFFRKKQKNDDDERMRIPGLSDDGKIFDEKTFMKEFERWDRGQRNANGRHERRNDVSSTTASALPASFYRANRVSERSEGSVRAAAAASAVRQRHSERQANDSLGGDGKRRVIDTPPLVDHIDIDEPIEDFENDPRTAGLFEHKMPDSRQSSGVNVAAARVDRSLSEDYSRDALNGLEDDDEEVDNEDEQELEADEAATKEAQMQPNEYEDLEDAEQLQAIDDSAYESSPPFETASAAASSRAASAVASSALSSSSFTSSLSVPPTSGHARNRSSADLRDYQHSEAEYEREQLQSSSSAYEEASEAEREEYERLREQLQTKEKPVVT